MAKYTRLVWTDEHNAPTVETLRAALEPTDAPLFDQARALFMGLEEIEESFRWFGDCWHWVIQYRLADHHEDEPLGIIIPSPEDLQIGMPMSTEFHETIATKRMKRMIKDGFELATNPYHTSWGVWSIATTGMITDIGQLAKQKLRWILDNH